MSVLDQDGEVAGDLLFVLVGLGVLARSADVFVVNAARLAAALHVSPVVIGAVVVGFGTGVPELLVSVSAASRGSLDLAAGNVVGSNLANLTLVLGVAGLIAQPQSVPRVLRREAPLSLASVALLAVVLQDGLTRLEGVVLLVGLVAAVRVMLSVSEAETADSATLAPVDQEAEEELVEEVEGLVAEEVDAGRGPTLSMARRDLVRAGIGLVGTVAGAQALVVGATGLAAEAGLSGGFVGLTLVAIGTSLPELVTGVQSARRNETALLVGNVLGSNLFNSLAVAGICALVSPGALRDPGLTVLAAGSMVLVAALAWLFLGLGGRLRRSEATALLLIYAVTLPISS